MKKIKSFTYLDQYKMYSISSQIFEGLTEYVIASKSTNAQEIDRQKGRKESGHVMADIITESSEQTEKKFLHDYAYTLFEEALLKEKKVLEIDLNNVDEEILLIDNYSFVKVKGKVVFSDKRVIENTIQKFNELGFSIGYVTQHKGIEEELSKITTKVDTLKDRNQKAKAKAIIDAKFSIKKLLNLEGLQLNPEYVKNLAYLLNYGFDGDFEVQIPLTTQINHYLFSSIVDRKMLQEPESNIVRKYSRATEKEFVLFGIPTQTQAWDDKPKPYNRDFSENSEDIGPKEAIMNFAETIEGIQKTFTGKLEYEYIIDPIAIYREL